MTEHSSRQTHRRDASTKESQLIPGIEQGEIKTLLEDMSAIVNKFTHMGISAEEGSPLHHVMLLADPVSHFLYWFPEYGGHVPKKAEKLLKLREVAGRISAGVAPARESLLTPSMFNEIEKQTLSSLFDRLESFAIKLNCAAER